MTLPKQSATLDGKALAQDYQGNNACISPSSLALLTDLTHLTRKILLQQKFGKKKYIWQKYVRNKKEVWNMCQMCQTSESYLAGSCCILRLWTASCLAKSSKVESTCQMC